ncbi:hypothetical protein RIF29_22855 [Crotalaria pallida]|uniref:Uncharacterized protein n=1 Tax=Crotalaria pallida TaxID=3830 RepID=A0AAN9F4W6_CROPI
MNQQSHGFARCDQGDFSDLVLLPEDLELTKQMNELGLPLSFHTTKETSPRSDLWWRLMMALMQAHYCVHTFLSPVKQAHQFFLLRMQILSKLVFSLIALLHPRYLQHVLQNTIQSRKKPDSLL